MKESQDSKLTTVVSIIVGTAIIVAIVCGILECFGVNTGWVGGVCSAIPMLFLAGFVVTQIIKEIIE